MMRIGISTTDFPQTPSDILFGQIGSYGYDTIQLSLTTLEESRFIVDGLYEIPEDIDMRLLAAAGAARRHGLEIAAINGTFNMAYPDAHARMEGVRRFDALAAAAADFECDLLTLCTGTRNKLRLWAYHPANAEPAAWADMMETMLRLTEIAERRKITLAIETEASNIVDTPEKARKALDEINSDRVGMIMDCANLFRRGEAIRANVDAQIGKAFDLYGDRVVLAHGKDVREDAELAFCAPGDGIINFELFIQLLNKYKYTGDMILHGIHDAAKMPEALEYMRLLAGANA